MKDGGGRGEDGAPVQPWDVADETAGVRIADILGLAPLPDEGGLYRQMWSDGTSTAIYFLLTCGDFSALHLLSGPETYHYYGGAPLQLLLLDDASDEISEPVLGMNLQTGQRPQLTVPGGVWQGSSSRGAWTLIGTTMAPGFSWDAFILADRGEMCDRFPTVAQRIVELTRAD